MGQYSSECLDIVCGLPQGSVLGPKLFILYINDLCSVSKTQMFFFSGADLTQLLDNITRAMSKLKQWFDYNKLSLNRSKTKLMMFGYKENVQINLKIGGIQIETVNENKCLGVIIDNKLT